MTVQNLIDEIVSDIGGDTDDSDFETKVLGFIKNALRRLPEKARARSIVSKKTVALASGDQTASIPSTFLQERAVWYETDGKRKNIEVVRDTKRFNTFYTSSVGYPDKCRIYGGIIEFSRPTDAAYTVYVDCFIEIDDVESGDTFGFDSSIAEIVKEGAKYYYFHDYVEDEEKGKNKLLIFNDGLKSIDHKYQREELPDHVEESEEEN